MGAQARSPAVMFDFWPFNLGPSEGWVFLYILMAGGVTAVTYWLCSAIGAALDRRPEGAPDLAAASGGGGPSGVYRTPGLPRAPGTSASPSATSRAPTRRC